MSSNMVNQTTRYDCAAVLIADIVERVCQPRMQVVNSINGGSDRHDPPCRDRRLAQTQFGGEKVEYRSVHRDLSNTIRTH
jgi:hypothetical protein